MPRLLIELLLAAVAALLWVATDFAASHRVFGAGGLPMVLHIAAALATAAVFVSLGSRFALRYGFARRTNVEPSELQRGLVLAALCLVASAAVLAHFGFDFSSILVFSALITGVIGLSIQPILGSLISGLAAERVIGLGDGILLGSDAVEVTALRWRSVVARRSDGTRLVMPNARLIDSNLEILSRDQSVRADARFDLPSSVPPHRLQRVVAELVVDFPELDRTRPIRLATMNVDRAQAYPVLPGDSGPDTIRYRVTFWVRHFSQRGDAESRLLRRLWYGLRRNGLLPATDEGVPVRTAVSVALERLDNEAALGFANEPGLAAALIEMGRPLLYDDGEPIVLPAEFAGQFCLLVEGAVADDPGPSARAGLGLTRDASIAHIKRLLADRIGPFAVYAVDQAAKGNASLAAVCEAVAEEIEDENERAEFLAAANMPAEEIHGPGLLFRTRTETGRVLSRRPLRAIDHALILVAPGHAFPGVARHALAGATPSRLEPDTA
jgi:small-conductance mechanosensitive channel